MQPRSRAEIVERVHRINAALIGWDQFDANALLPPDLRREVVTPILDRATLKQLRRMLLAELKDLQPAA
jgi:hypothetical protein